MLADLTENGFSGVLQHPQPQADIQQSLTTLREKSLKIGATVVGHGRYVTFQLAEAAAPRELFRKVLRHEKSGE